MSESLSDSDIVRGLRNGDCDAWSALCDRYASSLWKFLARLIGSDSEAVADLLQETLLAVAKSGRQLGEDTRLWSWLATIAHRQAALYWRKRYRRSETFTNVDVSSMAKGSEPVELLAHVETNKRIRVTLAEMSAEYAAVLTAKYLDGLSVAEIVETYGGTDEAVRSRLARARREFRGRYVRDSDES